ncbi:MAG: hypothetical protein ABR912_12375 [Terracidiphilus sp.]|jgi:P-type conjugative transfer protein TrbJ
MVLLSTQAARQKPLHSLLQDMATAGRLRDGAGSIRGALDAAGFQDQQFNSDESLLQTLQGQSMTAVGRMQALEVGNQIAENQSEQLMKLRQLMMADMQSKASYQGALVQAEATKQANSDLFFGQTQVTSDGVSF